MMVSEPLPLDICGRSRRSASAVAQRVGLQAAGHRLAAVAGEARCGAARARRVIESSRMTTLLALLNAPACNLDHHLGAVRACVSGVSSKVEETTSPFVWRLNR